MNAKAQSILIVDDEPQICKAIHRTLRCEGYRVHTANDAVSALQVLAEEPVDVVMSDYMMPGTNGVELLRQVSKSYPDTVRMMLSGQADMQAVVEALNAGAIAKYIAKPWQNDALRDVVAQALALRAERHRKTDETTGWCTRSSLLSEVAAQPACGYLVVGEIHNEALSLGPLSSAERALVYAEMSVE